jgi:hypothetical protein
VAVCVAVGVLVAGAGRGVTVGGADRAVAVEKRVGVANGVSVCVAVFVGKGVPGVIVGEGVRVRVIVGIGVECGNGRVLPGTGVLGSLSSWTMRPSTVAVGNPRGPPGAGPRSQAARSNKGTPTREKQSASRHNPWPGLGGSSSISGCFIRRQYNTVQSAKSKGWSK